MDTKQYLESAMELFQRLADLRHTAYVEGESSEMDYYYRGKSEAFKLAAEHLQTLLRFTED